MVVRYLGTGTFVGIHATINIAMFLDLWYLIVLVVGEFRCPEYEPLFLPNLFSRRGGDMLVRVQ